MKTSARSVLVLLSYPTLSHLRWRWFCCWILVWILDMDFEFRTLSVFGVVAYSSVAVITSVLPRCGVPVVSEYNCSLQCRRFPEFCSNLQMVLLGCVDRQLEIGVDYAWFFIMIL